MGKIKISNLKLRTIIGIYDWEREHKQDIILNCEIVFDSKKAEQSDCLEDTVNYKVITKNIIQIVESSHYFLIEKLARKIVDSIMLDKHVNKTLVKIDKPHALRFSDSVSFELEYEK